VVLTPRRKRGHDAALAYPDFQLHAVDRGAQIKILFILVALQHKRVVAAEDRKDCAGDPFFAPCNRKKTLPSNRANSISGGPS
jgi:hypothetical protein